MAKQTLNALRTKAAQIKNELVEDANSAIRVGGFLADLTDSSIQEFDPSVPYSTGIIVVYNGYLAKTVDATLAGQTPDSHPLLWSSKIVLKGTGITLGNPNPVSANALAEFVRDGGFGETGNPIPNADTDTRGLARQVSDGEYAAGTNNDAYTTAKQVKGDINALADAFHASVGTLQQVLENGATATTAPEFDGGLLATLPDAPANSTLLTVSIDPVTKILYKGTSGTVVTPPTTTQHVWRNFKHYIEVANDSVPDTIYADVDNGNYLPDDTPIPVVANPQADVTITADGDQTITLADNEFTVVGGTKSLNVWRYDAASNTVFALPSGVTFDPDTRVITIAAMFANQAVALRVTCQDILSQANWDDFQVTVNRSIPANTVKYVQARLVTNYFGSGASNDLLEIQMLDGYADQPMFIDVELSSASAPTSFGTLFQRSGGAGSIRSFQLASGQNLKSKTFKIYISTATSGAANVGVYTMTTSTTSTSGFVTLS